MHVGGIWRAALGFGVACSLAACAPKPPMTPDPTPVGAPLGWAVRVYADDEPVLEAVAMWALEREGLRVLHASQRGAADATIRLHTISLAPDGTGRKTVILAAMVHGEQMDPITLEYTPPTAAAGPDPAIVATLCTTFVHLARDEASGQGQELLADPTRLATDP